MVGTVMSFLKQSLDLVDDPARAGGWVQTDPVVLRSQGESSGGVPGLIARVAPTLPGLENALAREARTSSTSALASPPLRSPAAGNSHPRVSWGSNLGSRRWSSAAQTSSPLDLVTASPTHRSCRGAYGQGDLRLGVDARTIPVADGAQAAAPRVAASLRPGGWLILGRYASPADPLAEAIGNLRTVRGGDAHRQRRDRPARTCRSSQRSRDTK